MSNCFSEYISNLKVNRDIQKIKNMSVNSLSNGMTILFDMLRSWYTGSAAIWISLVLSAWIGVGSNWGKQSLANNPRSQTILEQVADMVQYLDSVDDLDTRACFLLFQETWESPRNIHQPHNRTASIRTSSSICITKCNKTDRRARRKKKIYYEKYLGDAANNSKIEMLWNLHKLTSLLDNKWYIRPIDGQAVETAN